MPTIKNVLVTKPSAAQSAECRNWPIWTCGVSQFEWEYTQTEKCLILEGKVRVHDLVDPKQSVSFAVGDYVVFPDGLKCVWEVIEPVKKHYDFE
ncbi:MAG: cupin domain-containing protein [Planctomycetaceae bacterium]|nr:cupin domain-containing protein [Planctomycetaceae bacterium]